MQNVVRAEDEHATIPSPRAARTPGLALLVVALSNLAEAAKAHDDSYARECLAEVLSIRYPSGTPDRMTADKTHRAFFFHVERDEVRYHVWRHPGSRYEHRVQVRSVDLRTGEDGAVHDQIRRLTIDDLARIVAEPRNRRIMRPCDAEFAARDGVRYAYALNRKPGAERELDIALGWCAYLARRFTGHWEGRAGFVKSALDSLHGDHLAAAMADDFVELAYFVNLRAAVLWAQAHGHDVLTIDGDAA
jgi:hypothetical protein